MSLSMLYAGLPIRCAVCGYIPTDRLDTYRRARPMAARWIIDTLCSGCWLWSAKILFSGGHR